ncbi:SDR family oxidoreductase [Nocardia sp. CA2R105]|uniref:SDR family NAD(P)-dependent oxidoreductase n=1 Tax=Nocardia coffeae TaxID=2873381 RepID=UPI001CA63998|nr:SDR family NAD(P)-dependent oxidoreductase [Nocardia coffeae]MBY8862932.1 SDR family oxidoreductase [Nocardia coffeae]
MNDSEVERVGSELRFDDRVVIVTGAGRAIGRAEALLLAERGAKVVVNDLGGAMDGSGEDTGPAYEVAREIVDLGGEAFGNAASVADQVAMRALVAETVDRFGRIDAVINNAGILTTEDVSTLPLETLERHLQVHLIGSFNVTQAAWPHFVEQGYGRVVMTLTGALMGSAPVVAYSTAKGGLFGLTRNLAENGAAHGIKVNAIVPSAFTRLAGDKDIRDRAGISQLNSLGKEGRGQPEEVAPAPVFLVHEECPVTGEVLTTTGTNVARWFLASTPGYTQADMTLEAIRDNWDRVCDERGYAVPRTTSEHAAFRTSHSL